MASTASTANNEDVVLCTEIIERNVTFSIINTDLMTDYQELKSKTYNQWLVEFNKIELNLNPDPLTVQKVDELYNTYINIEEPKLYPLYDDICCYLDKTDKFDKINQVCIDVTKEPALIPLPTSDDIATSFNNFLEDTKTFFNQSIVLPSLPVLTGTQSDPQQTSEPQTLQVWEITLIVLAILIVISISIGLTVYFVNKRENEYDSMYYSFGSKGTKKVNNKSKKKVYKY